VPIGQYQVVTNMPRAIFNDGNISIADAKLQGQVLLFVEEMAQAEDSQASPMEM